MLTLLIAINTAGAAGFVIGLVGFAVYLRLDRTDRLRHMLEAALGAAFLLEPGATCLRGVVKGEVKEKAKRRRRLLFVNKKKQKNFINLGPCRSSASGPKSKKFLRRFF